MKNRVPSKISLNIRCGDKQVGVVTITDQDNWHTIGRFEEGSDFHLYSESIHRVRDLQEAAESDPTIDWMDDLEIVNDFGFVAEWPDGKVDAIRDLQIKRNGLVTLKVNT